MDGAPSQAKTMTDRAGHSPVSTPESPAPFGKRERNKQEKRARILEAGRSVFASKGFAAAGIQEIAALADVAAGTVFLYVRSKEDLLIQCVSGDMDQIADRASKVVAADGPVLDVLLGIVDLMIDYHFELGPELSAVLLRELMSGPLENRVDSHPGLMRCGKLMATAMHRAWSRGEVRREIDPVDAADMLFSIFHWNLAHWSVGRLPAADLPRLVRSRFRSCMAGLQTGSAPAVPLDSDGVA